MKSSNVLLGVCLSVALGYVAALPNAEWMQFKARHDKSYESREEELLRQAIYTDNKNYVNWFNANKSQESGFRLRLNHLADLTEAEYQRLNGFRLAEDLPVLADSQADAAYIESILSAGPSELPDEVDWRQVPNRVSAVKNQGGCGSCWAFSTTGVLEGQLAVRNASLTADGLVALSEQNLIDCDGTDYGCGGGNMALALQFVAKEGGLESERSYQYLAYKAPCKFRREKAIFTDKGYAILPSGDENKLKAVVAKFGPVAVAINDASIAFHHYDSGVYYEANCDGGLASLGHAVLVVGYGTDPQRGDFWLVKNSWSSKWGEKGYIKMARNRNNSCGIATMAVIPKF